MNKLLVIAPFLLALPLMAEQPVKPTVPTKPSELASLKLENTDLKLKASWAQFQADMKAFQGACAEVVKELGLPEGTTCNPENMQLMPPATVAAPAAAKPEVKKP